MEKRYQEALLIKAQGLQREWIGGSYEGMKPLSSLEHIACPRAMRAGLMLKP